MADSTRPAKKTAVFSLRCSPKQLEWLRRKADRLGISVTALLLIGAEQYERRP